MARKTARFIGVTAYFPPDEYAELKANAARVRMSQSKYLRIVAKGQPVRSLELSEEILGLHKLRSTIGSLGGLLKQAIATGSADKAEVSALLRQLDNRQREIQIFIDKIDHD